MKSNKYVEVSVNSVYVDAPLKFCYIGRSEYKAAQFAKELVRNSVFSGYAVRKDKRNSK